MYQYRYVSHPPTAPVTLFKLAWAGYLAVLGALVAASTAVNLGWTNRLFDDPMVSVFVVQPAVWLLVAAIAIATVKISHVPMLLNRKVVYLALVIGVFHTSVLFSVGILVGFGLSPYARTWPVWPMNVAYFASSIVAFELVRAFILARWKPATPWLPMLVLGAGFALLSVSLLELAGLVSARGAVRVASSELVPLVGEHALATYLALAGGAVPAIAYRMTTQLLWWLSPALPSIPWQVAGLLGVAVPLVAVKLLRIVSGGPAPTEAKLSRTLRMPLRPWPVVTFLSVLVLWFGIGVFPYRPLAVGGDSMAPTYHLGDLVVVHRISPYEVKVGDVIQYQMPQGRILHRVVDRELMGDRPVFITRGDNNSLDDPAPVLGAQVTGVVVADLPMLGWVGLHGQRAFGWAMDLVR